MLWGRDLSVRNSHGKSTGKAPPTRALARGSPVQLFPFTGRIVGKFQVSQSREVCS